MAVHATAHFVLVSVMPEESRISKLFWIEQIKTGVTIGKNTKEKIISLAAETWAVNIISKPMLEMPKIVTSMVAMF